MRLSTIFLLLLMTSLVLVGCDDSDDPTDTPIEVTPITTTSQVTNTPTTEPTPEPTIVPLQKPELVLDSGQIFNYSMSTDAGEYGSSRYQVMAVNVQADTADTMVYTIQANVEMAATCPTTPTTGTATLKIDQFGVLVSYVEAFSVGSG